MFHTMSSASNVPQTGLALMGFSRYCPSSLHLTNFVVRSHDRATAESSRRMRWPYLLDSLGSGNPGIWKWNIQSERKREIIRMEIRFAQNVGEADTSRETQISWLHFTPFQVNFPMDQEHATKNMHICSLLSLVVQWLQFDRFGAMVAIFLLPSA